MTPWPSNAEPPPSLAALMRSPEAVDRVMNLLPQLDAADTPEDALHLLTQAVQLVGADAAAFMSYLRDDATRASYRSLLACDPAWAAAYASQGWFKDDPWLRHASQGSEVVRSSELTLTGPREQAFMAAAAELGFASAVIAPAPSSVGLSRVGVLSIGSRQPGYFDDEGYPKFKGLARASAMSLHEGMLRSIRREVLLRSRLTAADIELLRFEAAGQGSKAIGTLLGIGPRTVDCRFQRISAKLDAPDRRSAARIAQLYGLL
jgi:DNA-binding NarL/FixJ family response regulator